MAVFHKDGLSTAVRIRLEFDGHVLRASQVGDDTLILKEAFQHPATDNASIVIAVDGDEIVYPVILREGINGRVVSFQDAPFCDLPRSDRPPASDSDCPF